MKNSSFDITSGYTWLLKTRRLLRTFLATKYSQQARVANKRRT